MTSLSPDMQLLVVVLMVVIAVAVVMIAIQVFICWLLYDAWRRIPPPYREGEPWHAWMMLVPFANLIMPFFIHPRISRSYRNYLAAWNIHDSGDCGEQLGFTYAICAACGVIPYLNILAALAGLVIIIVYLLKINELKKRLMAPQQPRG